MGNVVRTANSHQTSLLVSEHIPDFIRSEHPTFVTFIEKYYEFLANNSLMATTSDSSVNYYGVDTATKILPDLGDVDTTDLDNFSRSFNAQYGKFLPENFESEANRRNFQKNILDFYRSVGTADSVRYLFRLLFNEEIDLRFPIDEVLITSGGEYLSESYILVPYVAGLEDMAEREITGVTSGATARVNGVHINPTDQTISFNPGRHSNSHIARMVSNNVTREIEHVMEPEFLRIHQPKKAFLIIDRSTLTGKFQLHETIYTSDSGSTINSVVLPVTTTGLMHDDYSYMDSDNMLAPFDDFLNRNTGTNINYNIKPGNVIKQSETPAGVDQSYIYPISANSFTSSNVGYLADFTTQEVGNTRPFGWTPVRSTIEIVATGGTPANVFQQVATGIFSPNGGVDPYAAISDLPSSTEFSTEYSVMSICYRQTVDKIYDENMTSPGIQFFFANGSTSYGSTRRINIKFPNDDPTNIQLGKWYVHRYDLSDHAEWKHPETRAHQTIDKIRFDIGGHGYANQNRHNELGDTFQVAWIRFDNPGSDFAPLIEFANTGPWYTANGAGQIRLIGGPGTDTVDAKGKILVIGDTLSFGDSSTLSENLLFREKNQTERFLVWNQKIPFRENTIYKMSVRAKGLGGRSSFEESANSGSLFSAGVITYASNGAQFFTDISNTYVDITSGETKAISLVANSVAMDDSFFTYSAYFSGRQLASEIDTFDPSLGTSIVAQTNPYRNAANNYGSGGRLDLPGRFPTGNVSNPTNHTFGISDALAGNAKLPYHTTHFSPFIRVNQTLNPSVNSLSRSVIDSVKVEVVEPMHTSEGRYLSEKSLLSTPGAKLRGENFDEFSYEINSEQDSTNYYTIVRDSVHPAGLKMLARKTSPRPAANTKLSIHQSPANNSIYSNTNIQDLWSPTFDTTNSLAGWWSGDSLNSQNVNYPKAHPELPDANNTFASGPGTVINHFPNGASDYEHQKPGTFNYSDQIRVTTGTQGAVDMTTEEKQRLSGFVVSVERGDSPIGGDYVLNVLQSNNQIDTTSASNGYFFPASFGNTNYYTGTRDLSQGAFKDVDTSDARYEIILEPHKRWLASAYVKTSNIQFKTGSVGLSVSFAIAAANSSGYVDNIAGPRAQIFETANEWERKSVLWDLTNYPTTKHFMHMRLIDHSDMTHNTGNASYQFDGFMIEEFNPSIHGEVNSLSSQNTAVGGGPFTPSPYVKPGLNYGNVHSWFDRSPNEHHVYANTHDIYLYPQYVANGINGYPVVRFRSNTVKSTANSDAIAVINNGESWDANTYEMFNQNYNNVYVFSTLGGGTANASGMRYADRDGYKRSMATTTLQSKMIYDANGVNIGGTLAVPSLPRPVSNQWTMMAVAKLNLPMNSIFYGRQGPADTPLYRADATIFNSGYSGVSAENRNTGDTRHSGGNMDLRIRNSDDDDVNAQLQLQTLVRANSSYYGFYQPGTYDPLANQFNIFTTSEFAGNNYLSPYTGNSSVNFPAQGDAQHANSDIVTFFMNGRRYGSAGGRIVDQMSTWNGFDANTNNTLNDGMVWYQQNNYVTSIGGIAPSNNQVFDTSAGGVNHDFIHHSNLWDGDVAEILVFNKKLSNSQIATIEGYLAHKYGIQDRLVWKDGSSSDVATEFSSAGVHHPFRFEPPKIGFNPFDSNTYYSNY